MKKDNTIRDLVQAMHDELRDIYPENEIKSLTEIVFTRVTHLKKRHHLHIYQDHPVDAERVLQIKDIIKQLKSGKPIQQILGETAFYDLEIKVSPEVLIPRQETEELVDWMISDLKGRPVKILDIGTGTGCIAIALAGYLKEAQVHALDVSSHILELARENARINKVNIRLILADILKEPSSESPLAQETYQVIVSNPPYVRESEKSRMHPNVRDHEPDKALFVSDEDPLIFYRQILLFARHHLAPEGLIWFEINESLGRKMITLLKEEGYRDIQLKKDIHNKHRMIKAQKP